MTAQPSDGTDYLANLEAARAQMAATVLEIRARYEREDANLIGQRLLSAAVRDLEDIDLKLDQVRRAL
ncbi:hypothetical protein GC088_04705 [Arthrobacter sp. JZ12]|uniref:hypothetical protein n=1 Tax=Arthrobacter sp. JZ12 TaxID=2654190 RepID=UPI002B46D50B|nr:hypothetical protein [Arthrobacter sp. JZ12]WRH24451.1 hypothetical protein GC088_04705 [Arthrobacter sp. JZ12]